MKKKDVLNMSDKNLLDKVRICVYFFYYRWVCVEKIVCEWNLK